MNEYDDVYNFDKDDLELLTDVVCKTEVKASESLGITSEYTGNRQELWDSTKSKNDYRDSVFGDKKTIIDDDNNILHKSHSAAKKKYHQKNASGENISVEWAKHAAEVDHRVSLESLHKRAKLNPFLTDNDLKEVANCPENYQILSKSENASKGAINSADLKTHTALHNKFAKKTVNNVSSELAEGATDNLKNASISIIVESLNKLLIENESIEDTLKYAGKSVVNTAIVGGTQRLLVDTAKTIFVNSGNEVLNNIVQMNAVGQCVVLASAIGKSAYRYLNGEITTEQLADEILLNGSIIGISTIIGAAIPIPLLTPIITCVAVHVMGICHQTMIHLNDYKKKENIIKNLEQEALSEIKTQRKRFNELVNEVLDEWDTTVRNGMDEIFSNAIDENFNFENIINGLDKILSLFGESSKFHSIEEWESQLDIPLELTI